MNSVLPQLSTGMLTFFGWQSRLQPCPAPAIPSTATMTTSCILCWVQLRRLPQEGIRPRIRYWSMSERIWEGSINVWHSLEAIYSVLVIEPLRYQCLMLDLDQQNIFQFHLYGSINLHLLEIHLLRHHQNYLWFVWQLGLKSPYLNYELLLL